MKKVTAYLKDRWGVSSEWQVLVILFLFAITGMTSVAIKKPIFSAMGISWESSPLFTILAYIFVFFPLYQVLFLIYGFLLGQFEFAKEFEKKTLGRFLPFIKKL